MNPWMLYLVLKLDTISASAMTVTCFLGLAAVAATVVSIGFRVDGADNPPPWTYSIVLWLLTLLGMTLTVVIPTTKQAAVIWAVPAIVNNEDVRAESAELYDLAKRWMREQVEGEPKDNAAAPEGDDGAE